ncbi:unnamed protein product [Haemonchus placei]|uniref:Ovule protein n=1 Tax=Haemonchus placei TaxID=6290 RepID=A0A0N4W8P1_HAEPC|nr:unnamed protein product [Haemonchus placei]
MSSARIPFSINRKTISQTRRASPKFCINRLSELEAANSFTVFAQVSTKTTASSNSPLSMILHGSRNIWLESHKWMLRLQRHLHLLSVDSHTQNKGNKNQFI